MKTVSIKFSVVATMTAVVLSGCTTLPVSYFYGQQIYGDNCVMCHGDGGQGDGPMADQLYAKPADLTRLTLENNGEYPRNRVLSHIDGYARGGNSSGAMPEFGLLLLGDDVLVETGEGIVTPTPKALIAVSNYIESLQIDG